MKTIACLTIAIAAISTGCINPSLIRALAKDPATAHVRITTIYGTVEISRTNPGSNSPPHSVNADGTIEVK